MESNNPIGIFDSGVGGLNTLKILKVKLPNENFIYFADNINLPYGEKNPEQIIKFSANITRFFIEKNVKIIVIPCNTSVSISLDKIKELANLIEIFDIISPIVHSISKKKHLDIIAVIATSRTVSSNMYLKKFQSYNSEIKIVQIPCHELVSIVENNLIEKHETEKILLEYFDEILKNPKIKTLIYGCTHYQHLDKKIKKIFSDHGRDISILNPDDFLCEEIFSFLKEKNLSNNSNKNPKIDFYVSGKKKQFFESAKNFFDFVELDKIRELKNFHDQYN